MNDGYLKYNNAQLAREEREDIFLDIIDDNVNKESECNQLEGQ